MANTTLLSLEDPLAEYVANQQAASFEVYAELQALVVLWKVDMMSSLCSSHIKTTTAIEPCGRWCLGHARRCFALLVLFSTIRFVLNGGCIQVLDPTWTFPFDGFEWLPRPNVWGAASLFSGMMLGGLLMLRARCSAGGPVVFLVLHLR